MEEMIEDFKKDLYNNLLQVETFIHQQASKYAPLYKVASIYMNRYHGINIELNNFVQQVTSYTNKKGLEWTTGLFDLLDSIQREYANLCVHSAEEDTNVREVDFLEGTKVKHIVLSNGARVKIGSIIQLTDKIGNDFRQTKFFDAYQPCPDWSIFYPSEKDFQFLYFYFKGSKEVQPFTFGRTTRIFSNTFHRVNNIYIHNGETIACTDLLKIHLEDSINEKEIVLIDKSIECEEFINFSSLFEQIEYQSLGFFSEMLNYIMRNWVITHLHYFNKEWHKYDWSMGRGCWYERANPANAISSLLLKV